MRDQKVCARCGEAKSHIWYFCKKDKVHICYMCAQRNYSCPVCKSKQDLVRVS